MSLAEQRRVNIQITVTKICAVCASTGDMLVGSTLYQRRAQIRAALGRGKGGPISVQPGPKIPIPLYGCLVVTCKSLQRVELRKALSLPLGRARPGLAGGGVGMPC